LWRHEYLNVLATFVREDGATIADAKALWRQGIELFGPREQDLDMESALALATGNRISAYDAQYVALARQLQTVCVTEDQRLLKTFPESTRTMQAFAAT
jgi:predicted nucleic acid-binding protein